MLREIIGDDDVYERWANTHPTGYVINTTRSRSPTYMQLHLSTCRHIRVRGDRPPGAFTERQYIKICADTKGELRRWASGHGCDHIAEQCYCLTH